MLEIIWQFMNSWDQNNLVVAIVSSLLTAFIIFFSRQIWHFFPLVFKWLTAIFSKQGKDYAFERTYLNWVINQHRYLGLLPARIIAARWGEEGRNVELEKVYVSLHVSPQGGDKNSTVTSMNDSSSWRKQTWLYRVLVTLWGREETYQLGDLAQAIDSHKQLVIRGDPGAGKTTLLRYLAVICARALRNSKKHGDVPNIVKKRLLWTTRPFPILVTLRLYSNVALWAEHKRLIDVFAEEIPNELQGRCPEGFFERKLAKGDCLILLDAFDELGNPEARAVMARRIEDFLSVYDHPRNRVVVTTRIVGYEGQLDRYGFQIRTVEHLKAGEIRALVKQRYNAIAISEKQDMRRRSEQLIKRIESTPRLAQLATNPLLLSLIVLVHRVKLELPEERVQLYRECVEILTEQWQSFKRKESGMLPSHQEELNLSQKLVLLQALALNMQQKRDEEDRQTLLAQSQAQEIIADKLPNMLGSHLPLAEDERREMCRRKAAAWVKGIQTESGILVEQGLDEAGDPLIGFSHLTFQEYLTATAINEVPTYQPLLTSHLLQSVWREVVLLYVALTSDATSIIEQLLYASEQPAGALLAGFCLAEKVKYVKNDVQHLTLTELKTGFERADGSMTKTFGQALAVIGGSDAITFLRGQIHSRMPAKRLEAIKALGQIRSVDPHIKDVQEDLVKLLETSNDVALRIEAREALTQIGDPRFTSKVPVVVSIPQQTGMGIKKLPQRFSRVVDYWCFVKFHRLRQQLPHKHPFAIGKYLVTNIEYARFLERTRHHAPKYWIEGIYPAKKATHPVTDITMNDAKAYCVWLSQETGATYRLPTEWEWEWAATGPQGWKYPWGEQFRWDKCNTQETAMRGTTPVGSYLYGTSQYGLTDMIGNVWEITQGYTPSNSFYSCLLFLLILLPIILSPLFLFASFMLSYLLLLFIVFSVLSLLFLKPLSSYGVLRGGAFDTLSYQATCFHREKYTKPANNVGFRCVREI